MSSETGCHSNRHTRNKGLSPRFAVPASSQQNFTGRKRRAKHNLILFSRASSFPLTWPAVFVAVQHECLGTVLMVLPGNPDRQGPCPCVVTYHLRDRGQSPRAFRVTSSIEQGWQRCLAGCCERSVRTHVSSNETIAWKIIISAELINVAVITVDNQITCQLRPKCRLCCLGRPSSLPPYWWV